jgi:DNA invertase Pin-like site-specific DNA recombinase
VFATALQKAKKLKAPIVVAKLDRLSRDVALIATLMIKKVEFVTADDPTKSPFMLHIKAAVAQEERRMIAQRTREALAAAKERGVKFGNQAQTAVTDGLAPGQPAWLVRRTEKFTLIIVAAFPVRCGLGDAPRRGKKPDESML